MGNTESSSASRAAEAAIIHRPVPTWRLVLYLAWPVLAQQGLNFLVTQSDRYLAGVYQPEVAYQAAQTTANYLQWVIISYTLFVTIGSTALVARFVGAGERQRAIHVTNQALVLAVGFGGAGTAGGAAPPTRGRRAGLISRP